MKPVSLYSGSRSAPVFIKNMDMGDNSVPIWFTRLSDGMFRPAIMEYRNDMTEIATTPGRTVYALIIITPSNTEFVSV